MAEKKKFNLFDMLNDTSKAEVSYDNFNIEFIDIDKIIPSKNNFYSVKDVEELKESIELYGLQQNLVLRQKAGNDFYELISGERRYTALKILVSQEGREDLRRLPCKVEYNINDIRAELQLIFANSTTRVISDYEKMQQATKMKELLKELKASGIEISGRLRDIVADNLNVSPTQIARMDSISNNLSEEFKEEFKSENINVSTAYELSSLANEVQREAYEEYKEKGKLEIKDAKKIKDNKKKEIEEQKAEAEIMDGQTNLFGEVYQQLEKDEVGRIYTQTKCTGDCICVHCGHKFDGLTAVNWKLEKKTVQCPCCSKNMGVQIAIEFTCFSLEKI